VTTTPSIGLASEMTRPVSDAGLRLQQTNLILRDKEGRQSRNGKQGGIPRTVSSDPVGWRPGVLAPRIMDGFASRHKRERL
jgi:hypothetical protein